MRYTVEGLSFEYRHGEVPENPGAFPGPRRIWKEHRPSHMEPTWMAAWPPELEYQYELGRKKGSCHRTWVVLKKGLGDFRGVMLMMASSAVITVAQEDVHVRKDRSMNGSDLPNAK